MTIDVRAYFGNQIIYRAATGLEKALADVESWALLGTKTELSVISAELIHDTWSPYDTQLRNLPHLAWAMGVDIWEDGWSEATQREWVDRQWEFKAKRGTIGGIRMALEFAGRDFVPGVGGYKLIQYVVPPQDFFVSPDLGVEEFNAWIHLMPEIRIYFGQDEGRADGDEMYITNEPQAIDGFLDLHAIGFDDGPELYGRRAILRQSGHADIRLKVVQEHNEVENKTATDFEAVEVPGLSTLGLFLDEDALGEDKFICFEETESRRYTLRLDRTYDSRHKEYHLDAIVPSFEPLVANYERDSDIGEVGPFLYLGDGAVGVDFIEKDLGANMLADRLWLFDPDIAVPMQVGVSFLDVDRLGAHPYQMELMVDLRQKDDTLAFYVDDSFLENNYVNSEDNSHIDRADRAIVAAKSLRDRALVAFDPVRPLEVTDTITDNTRVSDWVRNTL